MVQEFIPVDFGGSFVDVEKNDLRLTYLGQGRRISGCDNPFQSPSRRFPMNKPKPQSKPAAKSQQKEPARKRRFQVVKLEERIAPNAANLPCGTTGRCTGR
jgi:hypothetical protein